MRLIAAVLPLLALAATAHADDERLSAIASSRAPAVRHYGVMVDAGAPEGAQLALVLRPIRALRLHGGAAYNGISYGMHAGVTLVPFASWCTPTLTADYGEFPQGDATHLVQLATGDPTASSPVLHRVGYRFANARLGLEFGRKRATFYVHAGVSRITGTVRDVGAVLADSDSDPDAMVTTTPPRVEVWTVSARVGLVLYFGP